MIYITGDCHGDFQRFKKKNFPEQMNLTRKDTMIILGDFGGIWSSKHHPRSLKKETWDLDWLDSRNFTTVFIDGNHENFDELLRYPIARWHGGNVHVIRPHIYHLMRGEFFEIEGKTFFTMGGASSHDIRDGIVIPTMNEKGIYEWRKQVRQFDLCGKYMYRVEHISWWKEEMPNETEFQHGRNVLKQHHNKVDYILSHSPSTRELFQLDHQNYKIDPLTDYLDEIMLNNTYQIHFFGHMHQDRKLSDSSILLYQQVVLLHS